MKQPIALVFWCALLAYFLTLPGGVASYSESPNFSPFLQSGQNYGNWRSNCYDPEVDSNLVLTGGWRMAVTASFYPGNVMNMTFFGYLGVNCLSSPGVRIDTSLTVLSQDSSNSAYTKWNFTLRSFVVTFQNAAILNQWTSTYSTTKCSINTFSPVELVNTGCGDFLASLGACPYRFIAFRFLDSKDVQFGWFFSQTNLLSGCSDPTIAANFSYSPTFVPANSTVPATLTLAAQSSNANPAYVKVGDTITFTITSNLPLQAAPFGILFGTQTQATAVSGSNTVFTVSFVLGSSTPETDVTKNIQIIDYVTQDGVPGSPVLGCTGCSSIFFDNTPPTLATWSYSVGGVPGYLVGSYVKPGQTIQVFIRAVSCTYSSSSVQILLNATSARNATLVSIGSDNTAEFDYTFQSTDPIGPIYIRVQNVYDVAGVVITPIIASPSNSNYRLTLSLSAAFASVLSYKFSVDATNYGTVNLLLQCDYTASISFVLVPDTQQSTLVANFQALYPNATAFLAQRQYAVQTVQCNTVQDVANPLNNLLPSTWYTVIYVTTLNGVNSPTPTVIGQFYTAKAFSCFSPSSTVQLSDGSVRSLSDLRVGDRVLSYDDNSHLEYSDVAYIHKHSGLATFLQMTVGDTELKITPNHLLFRSTPAASTELVLAEQVQVGDVLILVDSKKGARSASVSSIVHLYANDLALSPITLSGRVVVDGVAASCYGSNSDFLGHLSHFPHRMLYHFAPSLLSHPTALWFEEAVVHTYHTMLGMVKSWSRSVELSSM